MAKKIIKLVQLGSFPVFVNMNPMDKMKHDQSLIAGRGKEKSNRIVSGSVRNISDG